MWVDTISQVSEAVRGILESYERLGGINHIGGPNLPSRQRTIDILQTLHTLLFPGYYEREPMDEAALPYLTGERMAWVRRTLTEEITKSLCHDCRSQGRCDQLPSVPIRPRVSPMTC